MFYLIKAIKAILNPIINIGVCFLGIFIKRDRRIVLFGAWEGRRFAGNPRYLYQYLSENKELYGLKKVVWVTRDRGICRELVDLGYEAYLMHSLKSIWFHIKSGVHFCNVFFSSSRTKNSTVYGDIIGELSTGAVKVFMGHGVLHKDKCITTSSKNPYKSIIELAYKGITHLFVTGGWDDSIIMDSSIEGKVTGNYISTGTPELCPVVRYTKKEEKVLGLLANKQKTILFAPTYRVNGYTGFLHPLDSGCFRDYLRGNGYFWIDKLLDLEEGYSLRAKYYDEDISILLDSDIDLNPLIPKVDILITDYSTIWRKGIFFNKPVIMWWNDIDIYSRCDNKGDPVINACRKGEFVEKAYSENELMDLLALCTDDRYLEDKSAVFCEAVIEYFGDYEQTYDRIMSDLAYVFG